MNDHELQRFRDRLLEMRGRLTLEINRMADEVRRDELPEGEHDRLASEPVDKEVVLDHTEEALRHQVMKALRRLETGDYGQCQKCHRPISRLRLEAVPYATCCVKCERQREQGAWE